MVAQAQAIQTHSHNCDHLALACVVGGKPDAVAYAHKLLTDFANEGGMGKHREAALTADNAKNSAAMFALATNTASMNFTQADNGNKAPASAPGKPVKDMGGLNA
jgi:hypothetical protein